MATSRINYSPPVLKTVIERGSLKAAPFCLVDVGASGGIENHWRVFEPYLKAFAFDPLIKECTRLNANERNEQVRYYDRFLVAAGDDEVFPEHLLDDPVAGWSNQPFERTSARRAQKLSPAPPQSLYQDGDAELVYTDKMVTLDRFFDDFPGQDIDFLKIDTDGHDYEVLNGSKGILHERQVLGLLVECQFHGVTHEHSNLFANIDRFLRQRGFSMFDMELYRYTRDVLPGHFACDIAAQTREGQVLWADVLFLRDVAAPDYQRRWNVSFTPLKLLKLCCLFELFGMPDCAAETLVNNRDALAGVLDIDATLDTLTREIEPSARSFAEHNARFSRAPESFYPRSLENVVRQYAPQPVKRALGRTKRKLIDYLIKG